jgi:CubicO group peptidase (beta-lactamase class C family)
MRMGGPTTCPARVTLAAWLLLASAAAWAGEPQGLHRALEQLSRAGKFSGAVVIRDARGTRFSHAYGFADPFEGRRFTADTPVDGASLAKTVTAAGILTLVAQRKIALDDPVRRHVPEYPYPATTLRNLLAHSGGLPDYAAFEPLEGKTTSAMLLELSRRQVAPAFEPGSDFAYCNLCYDTLALVIERVAGEPYQSFVNATLFRPAGLRSSQVRPRRLADWTGRAIGYRHNARGALERFDSWEGEAFYGGGNIAFTAADLARWGAYWWSPGLAATRQAAVRPAVIAGRTSGLTWGNWYCANRGRRCHYLGHHEGFHHMVYWDADRRIAIAMVTNNALDPRLQQSLQRALVAFAEGRPRKARSEIRAVLPDGAARPGHYRLSDGEDLTLTRGSRGSLAFKRRGLTYTAFPAGGPVHYVPGLDVCLASDSGGRLHWSSLYEELVGTPAD